MKRDGVSNCFSFIVSKIVDTHSEKARECSYLLLLTYTHIFTYTHTHLQTAQRTGNCQGFLTAARPFQESPKESPGAFQPRCPKRPKQSWKSLRSLKTDCFATPETLFRLFRTRFGPRGRKAPGDSFGDSWKGRPRFLEKSGNSFFQN